MHEIPKGRTNEPKHEHIVLGAISGHLPVMPELALPTPSLKSRACFPWWFAGECSPIIFLFDHFSFSIDSKSRPGTAITCQEGSVPISEYDRTEYLVNEYRITSAVQSRRLVRNQMVRDRCSL
jgi:hypothetical protein